MLYGKYKTLYERLVSVIERNRLYDDPLHTLAYGTDASFYRLIPKLVVRALSESEVSFVLRECSGLDIPVTFRAAGTSLSGQAITDSVLLIAGSDWKEYHIADDKSEISLQPGITGGKANALLARYGRKIGPDPASINSAMIGGIAANNASGMCCGTALNSYKTVSGIRLIMADGTLLDTRDKDSRESFIKSHGRMLSEISSLSMSAKENTTLAERIRKKYKMKNTTGYSLNALVDFDDPFDIIEHLMIGSEGTLGFISGISFRTVEEQPFRASSLMIFPDIEKACQAVILLKPLAVSAVELIDRSGLRSVENEKGIPGYIKELRDDACALLVETSAAEIEILESNITGIKDKLKPIPVETSVDFTSIPAEYELLWNIRKGLFPSVGAMRQAGTTVIIEDVAFPVPSLALATLDLRALLKKYRYDEAVIFGHALEGNLHFVFTQDFNAKEELERYEGLMNDVASLVVNKYDGSLKAEHGTGRNMAPFVEMEWGKEAYELMKMIKQIFDPLNILNPGVILNSDDKIHLKNLKPVPAASEITDKCTECGFCEPSCVSAGLTLTPRQRIVVHRELISLERSGHEPHIAASIRKSYSYEGNSSCATDGLCAVSCPVKIDTGKLIKKLREEESARNRGTAMWVAGNMGFVTAAARTALSLTYLIRKVAGVRLMKFLSGTMRKFSGNRIPFWNPWMPGGAKRINTRAIDDTEDKKRVVYFPSCINRSMGTSHDQRDELQLTELMVQLLHKGGYEVIYPQNLNSLCCGMAFSSKGFTEAGKKKSDELESALIEASKNGEYPVLCDMSPCLFTMKENMKSGLKLYEPVEFILEYLIKSLEITPKNETITVFPVCSMKKMGLEGKLRELAGMCAKNVVVAESNCCGFAGDRGFTYPELNRHGLRYLASQLDGPVKNGYSTSRTCEIGLSLHTGISHKSIIYLVDSVSKPRKVKGFQFI